MRKRGPSGLWVKLLLVAVEAMIAIVAGLAAAHTDSYQGVVWAALVFILVAALTLFRRPDDPSRSTDAELVRSARQSAASRSAATLAAIEASGSDLDRIIPVEIDGLKGGAMSRADQFASVVAADLRTGQRWVVEGPPGSGKSTLLHRIAVSANKGTGDTVAVVIPLANYDVACERVTDWLVPEIARLVAIEPGDVRRLLLQGRVFPLLDGLDTVPSQEDLAKQKLPSSERALFDRILPYRRKVRVDPRQRFLSGLDALDSFLISVRTGSLAPEHQHVLQNLEQARLEDIPGEQAELRLRSRVHRLPTILSPGLREAIGSPLYLRLAGNVGSVDGFEPPPTANRPEVQAWLWDRTMDIRLAQRGARDLSWDPGDFRRWLAFCAAAAEHEDVLGLNRWPLLFGTRTREALRVFRAIVSGVTVGGLALALGEPVFAAAVGVVTAIAFYCAGEGAATTPMAPQRFSFAHFLAEARKQWLFAGAFTIIGTLIGIAVSEEWFVRLHPAASPPAIIATGTVAGVLLGFTVPTLYELSYVDDASLYSLVDPRRVLWGTAGSGVVIGATAGTIAGIAIYLAFHTALALLAIPLCILLAFFDVLGLPAAAVLLWAVQRRGPVRIGRFLALAADVHLVRRVGCYYIFEHGDLQKHLGSRAPRPKRWIGLPVWISALVALWLIGYAVRLGATLPLSYHAAHWRALWVGFDLALAALSLAAAFLLARGSAAVPVITSALAALIAADAWFDCMTARGSELTLALVSLVAELPTSMFFFAVALRSVRASTAQDDNSDASSIASPEASPEPDL